MASYVAGEGQRIINFGEQFVYQTKGRWAGKPIVHEPWQHAFLKEAFLRKPNGDRVYKRVLLGLPRKNGKSTTLSELALYHLIATGEQSPEVFACAASKDQAGIVFRQAREFVEASPKLRDWLTPQRNLILCKQNNGFLKALSSDAALQYGLNPNFVVMDELWAHPTPDLYYALATADIARENPMLVSITTAGFDRDSHCYKLYEEGKELRDSGGIQAMRDKGFLFWWYEAPLVDADGEPVDYRDESTWQTANPSSWVTNERLREYYGEFPEHIFRMLHLNQWVESADSWIKPWQWDQLKGKPEVFSNQATWMGVDVGVRKDSAAIVWGQWQGDVLHVGQKVLQPTGDSDFGVADVRETVFQISKELSNLKEVNFDPWQFLESSELLAERGLPMAEFPQNAARMGPATESLYELIREGRLVHNGEKVLRDHVLAAVAAPTDRGGYRLSKRKSLAPIDSCVALAMVADRATAMKHEASKRRVIRL